MSKFRKNFTRVSIGVGVGCLLISGGWVAYNLIKKSEEGFVDPLTWKTEKLNDEFEVVVREGLDKSEIPYLGEKGLELLKERINNEIGFGPEIAGFNSFNIVNGHYISSTDNGVFIGGTRQIYINAENMRLIVPQTGDIHDKVEMVFQVIYHEYGHYIAASYLKSYKSSATTTEIYSNTGPRSSYSWNKYFVDNFRSILHYNDISPFYKHALEGGYVPLGGIYSLKELFDITNGRNTPFYNKLTNKTVFGGVYKSSAHRRSIESSDLQYLYTLDELYTRKYQQIGMVLKDTQKMHKGWYQEASGSLTATPFLYDTLRYRNDVARHANWGPKSTLYTFMNDGPYVWNEDWTTDNSRAKRMYDLMLEEFGQKQGYDLSYITSLNKATLKDDNTFIYGEKYPVDSNKIKFGGFVNDTIHNVIGYFKDPIKKTGFVKIDDLLIHDFKYGYKSMLDSATKITVSSGDTKWYTTKNWLSVGNVKDRILFFAKDDNGTDPIKLHGTKNGKYGETSNYYDDAPGPIDRYYYSHEDSHGLSIKEGEWG